MRFVHLLAVGATLCLALGCESKPSEAKQEAPKSATAATSTGTPAASAAPQGTTDVSATIKSVLADYEVIRKQLAADDTSGIADGAKKIAEGTAGAEKSAQGSAKTQLGEVAKAADALSKEGGDIEAVRAKFGELSKALVALLVENAELRAGQHLFECPMAKGYKKWLQPSDKLENPYMGKKMLGCGGPADWKV